MIYQLLLFMKMNKLVNEKNLQFMREAFKEVFLLKRIRKDLFPNQAQIAYDKREVPNGCVFVHNDKIVGRGRNMTNETGNVFPHASRFFHLNGIIIVCYREPDMQNWQQLIKCLRLITLIQNCSKKQICIFLVLCTHLIPDTSLSSHASCVLVLYPNQEFEKSILEHLTKSLVVVDPSCLFIPIRIFISFSLVIVSDIFIENMEQNSSHMKLNLES